MFAREHLDEIGRVVNGGATGRDSVVQKSWLRCVNDYGLDPQRANSARIVTEATLRVHREQSQRLCRLLETGSRNYSAWWLARTTFCCWQMRKA